MRVRVTEEGVVIAKKLLNGAKEVEIRTERNFIMIVPKVEEDPILSLGGNPMSCGVPDVSENLDKYLYEMNQ